MQIDRDHTYYNLYKVYFKRFDDLQGHLKIKSDSAFKNKKW